MLLLLATITIPILPIPMLLLFLYHSALKKVGNSGKPRLTHIILHNTKTKPMQACLGCSSSMSHFGIQTARTSCRLAVGHTYRTEHYPPPAWQLGKNLELSPHTARGQLVPLSISAINYSAAQQQQQQQPELALQTAYPLICATDLLQQPFTTLGQ